MIDHARRHGRIGRAVDQDEATRLAVLGVRVEGDRAELAVAIRIFWRSDDEIHFGTGAGITWASDPMGEWRETELKARKLI
mgnify:CR=1 FL=1